MTLRVLRCARCGRAIFNAPAASRRTAYGFAHYGPKCAALEVVERPLELWDKAPGAPRKTGKASLPRKRPDTEPEDGQLDLFAQ